MATIYVVTEGNYSDYHIEALFDSRELAEKFCEKAAEGKTSYYEPCVEEYELNAVARALQADEHYYSLFMKRDGTTDSIEWVWDEVPEPSMKVVGSKSAWGGESYLRWIGIARSQQHAVKIANEIRAQMIANGEWPGQEGQDG